MTFPFAGLVYLLFFVSGATALVYQVVWVRSLTLVFGGSHLAVTAVLSIFMAGLAIGGYLFGRRVDRVARPLRLYALLEFGVAASALAFVGLMAIYPSLYAGLAQGRDEATLYLTAVRLLFSVAALIVPSILMGGTLPVLARFAAVRPEELRGRLSFLYGFNTLGAVAGAVAAGFFVLRLYAVSTALYLAVGANVLIGIASLALQRRLDGVAPHAAVAGDAGPAAPALPVLTRDERLRLRLVLWGIGVAGFCALGYEVLWTRVLTLAIGASVYGFTIMLAAFLTGIALGSKAYGAVVTMLGAPRLRTTHVVAWFGIAQVAVGVSALVVTVALREIPATAIRLQAALLEAGPASFQARVWANFALAFLYMTVPALFMGAAFPLAAEAVARYRGLVGRAVGEVLAFNTVGAILGAAASGLLMLHAFGIERSLQILIVMNIGTGLVVLAGLRRPRLLPAAVAAAAAGVVGFLALNDQALRMWDRNYFAIFRSNQPEAFRTPDMVREAVENTDVLYYAEGTEAIVSVIRVKGGEQAFVTNGRIEASTHLQAQQLQLTLGHLPMLLHGAPRKVLVVGLGSGMTAGAASVHPDVERVTLVEIEPKVLGVARTFEAYNHHVLDNPRVQMVLNDGRNFLLTTRETFDVITADPIHPWFRGAGYLYSSQYFALAAAHLRPGGVIAQWLPLYELTSRDLASIVRTFRQHFPHTLLWLTHYDAVMIGSRAPLLIDEAELGRRLAEPAIAQDLQRVMMGSADDLLSYFVMGSAGMARFAAAGTLNTDDHLLLEFSAPFSIADAAVVSGNVQAITADRESLLSYLVRPADPAAADAQRARCEAQAAAGRRGDTALTLFLGAGPGDARFTQALRQLTLAYPWYAPGSFLRHEYQTALALEPRLLHQSSMPLADGEGRSIPFEMSAVLVPVSRNRASVMFVDNRARVVYGQLYLDEFEKDDRAGRFALEVMGAVRAAYENETRTAVARGRRLPAAEPTLDRLRTVIGTKVGHGALE
jgi:spermidine synthase